MDRENDKIPSWPEVRLGDALRWLAEPLADTALGLALPLAGLPLRLALAGLPLGLPDAALALALPLALPALCDATLGGATEEDEAPPAIGSADGLPDAGLADTLLPAGQDLCGHFLTMKPTKKNSKRLHFYIVHFYQ